MLGGHGGDWGGLGWEKGDGFWERGTDVTWRSRGKFGIRVDCHERLIENVHFRYDFLNLSASFSDRVRVLIRWGFAAA